jgi:hypothetical protein
MATNYSLKVVIAERPIVGSITQATGLEISDPSHKGRDHFDPIFLSVLYRRERRDDHV